MTHASLFSGIGGFDLAAEWAGWTNVFNCEIDPFCRKVLKFHFPKAAQYEDIRTTDFTVWRDSIDVLTGGFPCQDASIAKQNGAGQLGLQGERTGLYTEMLRAIREIQPRYVIAENVSNIRKVNDGCDFAFILESLAGLGYNAEWRDTSASEVGAPHRRARCYMVAYPGGIRLHEGQSFFTNVCTPAAPVCRRFAGAVIQTGLPWDSELPVCLDDYGIPDGLAGCRSVIVKHTFCAPGNAIVPQVALRIFETIAEYEAKGIKNDNRQENT